MKKPLKDFSNLDKILEKLKINKKDIRLPKKEIINFKSDLSENIIKTQKTKLKEKCKEFSTISYREEKNDHRTFTNESSDYYNILNNARNINTEETQTCILNINNYNNKNDLYNPNCKNINQNKNYVSNTNNANQNINTFYNHLNNNNNQLEVIVEQSDTIRCSSQNNTATITSIGMTNKKNSNEDFLGTINSLSNISQKDKNNENANYDFNSNINLQALKEIVGYSKNDGLISERDLKDFTLGKDLNENNEKVELKKSQDHSNLKNFKNGLIDNDNPLTIKNNLISDKNIFENPETFRYQHDMERAIRQKVINKNFLGQNNFVKTKIDVQTNDSELYLQLNNSYQNNSNNNLNNELTKDYEITQKYINNFTEQNIPTAENKNNLFKIKSSNIINNNLLTNTNLNSENNDLSNKDYRNNINENYNKYQENQWNHANVNFANKAINSNLNKLALNQSKDKIGKITSNSNISSIHLISSSNFSELNQYTNRNYTNRENNPINYNNVLKSNNIEENIGIYNNSLLNDKMIIEKIQSTKNINTNNLNLANNSIPIQQGSNSNTFRSAKNNNNISLNSNNINKESSQNKVSSNINNSKNERILQNNLLTNNMNEPNNNKNTLNTFINLNQIKEIPLSNNEECSSNNKRYNLSSVPRKDSLENEKYPNCDNLNFKDKSEEKEKLLNEKNQNNKNSLNYHLCINLDQNFYQVNNYQSFVLKNNIKPEELKQTPYELLQDIFENLLKEEREAIRQFGYMKKQINVNENMRAILIDWIIEVHYKFKLLPETLYLTVNLIDRFLAGKSDVPKERLQLIGISAMLIACKYEEIYSPELRDFVYISEKSYDSDEILKMESEMLKILKFEICFPSINRFYEILCIIFNFSDKEIVLGKYLSELFLIDYRYTKYNSSLIACSLCYLIRKDERKEKLKDFLNLSQSDLSVFKECVKDICFIVEHIEQTQLIAIKKKYATKENFKFAKLRMLDLM